MHGIAAWCRGKDMTAKRNFKRRVRERQLQTGERYTAARRRILAERAEAFPEEAAPEEAAAKEVTAKGPEETAPPAVPREEAAAKTVSKAEVVPVEAAADAALEAAPAEAGSGMAPAESASGMAPDEAGSGMTQAKAASEAALLEVSLRATVPSPALDALLIEAVSVGAAPGTVSVIELLDVSDDASRLGLRCRVMMFPSLAERAEPASVLTRLRAVLAGTIGDPSTALLCSVALDGQRPALPRRTERDLASLRQFIRRAHAGLGGTTEDGTMLVFHVAGRDGIVAVLCMLSHRDRSLMLTVITGTEPDVWKHLVASRAAPARVVSLQEPVLFLIHDGQRYPVTADTLVIGSGRGISGLAIGDAALAPTHAAVIRRSGTYYLKDLDSIDGIHYKGMRIDNKRIDEGDVFHIGDHEIRFTFRDGG
jgi:hypothetical protein